MAQASASPAATMASEAAWLPLTMVSAKKRPWLAKGATAARSALQPDCESKPLTATRAPRSPSIPTAGLAARTMTRLQ